LLKYYYDMTARGFATSIAVVITLAVMGGALFSASNAVWGVNHLKYFGTYGDYVFVLLTLLTLSLAFGPLPRTTFDRGLDRVAAWVWGKSFIPRLLIATVLTLLFFLDRLQTAYLGDGNFLLNIFGGNQIYSGGWIEWLSYRAIKAVQLAFGGYTPENALYAFQTVSIVAGFFVVLNFIRIAGLLASSTRGRMLVLLTLLSSGWILLFFGYVEYYPLLWLAVSFLVVAALRCVNHKGPFWIPLLWFVVAAAIHLETLVFLPGMGYLVLYEMWPRSVGRLSSRAFAVVLWGLIILVPIAVMVAGRFLAPQINPFLSLTSVPVDSPSYAAFSFDNLIEILNQVMLCIPAILVLLSLAFVRRQKSVDHIHRLLVLFTFGSLAFLVMVDPKLGLGRDWDLMSLTLFAPVLLLVYRAARIKELSTRVILLVAVLSFSLTVPFLLVSGSTQTSAARMHDLLRHYGTKDRGGWLMFARCLYADGNIALCDEVTAESDELFPEQLYYQTARELFAQGKLDEAAALLQQCLDKLPENGEFAAALADVRLTQQRYTEARELYTRALRTHPNHYYYFALGRTCYLAGDYAAAVQAFEQARRLSPDTPVILAALGESYVGLRQFERAREMAEELLRLDPRSPDGHILSIDYLVGEGRNAEAVEHYKAFLQCGVDHPQFETFKNRYAWLLDTPAPGR
jgi:Flp pilus assembly protein TadD